MIRRSSSTGKLPRSRRKLLAPRLILALAGVSAALTCVFCYGQASVQDPLAAISSWQAPSGAQVRAETFVWLEQRGVSADVRAEADALWPPTEPPLSGVQLLERVVSVIALVDKQARQLVELCAQPRAQVVLPEFPWLDESAPFVRNNLQLWYGRWLSHERMYDESLLQLASLQPADVVDPASLLFYQGVAYHWMLNKAEGLLVLDRLMEKKGKLPRRYETLAGLMQADLSQLKDESLDHISRRMRDIERRLELGRVGKKVTDVEDGVIASLDKMIKDLEAQQQQQQQQGAGSAQTKPTSPARDSRPLGGKGPGEVVKKDIGNRGDWGDLPPKQRQEALQAIGKDFPSHYRDVIEHYFRRLANASEDSK